MPTTPPPTITCPFCGGHPFPIAYGFPGGDILDSVERGEVVLGGCVVMPERPGLECTECGHRWGEVEREWLVDEYEE